MNLCLTNRTIVQLKIGDAFRLSPSAFAIHFPKPLAFPDRLAGGDDFNILDPANNLEVHLKVWRGRPRPRLLPLLKSISCKQGG